MFHYCFWCFNGTMKSISFQFSVCCCFTETDWFYSLYWFCSQQHTLRTERPLLASMMITRDAPCARVNRVEWGMSKSCTMGLVPWEGNSSELGCPLHPSPHPEDTARRQTAASQETQSPPGVESPLIPRLSASTTMKNIYCLSLWPSGILLRPKRIPKITYLP